MLAFRGLSFGLQLSLLGLVAGCNSAATAASRTPTPCASSVTAAASTTALEPPTAKVPWPEPDDTMLEQIAGTFNFMLGAPASVWPTPDGKEVLFRRSRARSFVTDLYAYDMATGSERLLVSAEQLLAGKAEQLSVQERARRERQRSATRGISTFSSDQAGRKLLLPLSGRLFIHDREKSVTHELPSTGSVLDPSLAPDGSRAAYVSDGDLYVVDARGGHAPKRLTRGASDSIEHGVAEFIAQEEMGRSHGYWWSPDSKFIAYQRSDVSQVETLYIADATHPEKKPNAFRYPRVGTPNARVSLGVISASGGATTWLKWDAERYPYLAAVNWTEGGPLSVLVQNRAQTEELLLAADPKTGATRVLLTERDAAWLNLDRAGLPYWLPDGRGFLWSSERSGQWELELHAPDGALLHTVVPAALGYQNFGGYDRAHDVLWVNCSTDPRETQLYRVPLDGSAPVRVTKDVGDFSVRVSRNDGAYALTEKRADGVRKVTLWRSDGTAAGELKSNAEQPLVLPKPELLRVSVAEREHYAAITRPRSFEAGRKYPVLLSIYGGPGTTVVKRDPYAYLMDQWYADGGFIVVRADGRGTPGRGRDWERALKGQLAAVPLDDQIAVLQALGKQYGELDLERLGIVGWSYGGYLSAMGVLLHPEVFRAAVAGAPVTEQRDYDTHYTERYMGLLPEAAAAYDAGSAVLKADTLQRPLLLVHGTTDDNVYFAHSLKLSQALFRAGKPFEMLPLAGFTHMVPDPVVKKALARRTLEFFRRNL